jgi:hypothetical protein
VKSFHSFLPNAMKHFFPQAEPGVVPIAADSSPSSKDGKDGAGLAA